MTISTIVSWTWPINMVYPMPRASPELYGISKDFYYKVTILSFKMSGFSWRLYDRNIKESKLNGKNTETE